MATFRKRGKYWEYRVKYTNSASMQLVASHGGYRLKSSAQDAAKIVEDDLKRGGDSSKAGHYFWIIGINGLMPINQAISPSILNIDIHCSENI